MAALAVLAAIATSLPALAADLGGDCCADLEERIAELEATAARKGNRKVSLTVSGQVHQAILGWDDGDESDAYVVGNKNDQSNIAFAGDASIAGGWKAGYDLTLRLRDTLSDAVDQDNDDDPDSTPFQIWQAHWYIESERYGKVSVGLASRASDTAPERDLSETGVAAYAGVQDIGGGFLLRRADGELAGLTWGDLHSHLNGDTANVVRYDSPTWKGLNFAASWGEDDIWDVGINYAYEGRGIIIDAAIAYTEVNDAGGLDGSGDTDNATLVGSFAILHEVSGLNLAVAAGQKEFDAAVEDADTLFRTPNDLKFVYVKLGWLAKLNGLGPTAFYGEYGWFENYVSAGVDADGVASLSFTDAANVCVGAGDACRVTGSESEVFGFGVVQHIEAAEMQIYLGWRRHNADIDLVDVNGASAGASGIEDFDTIIAGSKIAF